ncbi:MAG: LysM peptidoglycan-binding domain-containing protein [Gemmataceae bacterium]
MSNDVKLAILAGVGLISAFALVKYKKDVNGRPLKGKPETVASTSLPATVGSRPLLAPPAYNTEPIVRNSRGKNGYYHRVQPNDTLIGLAQRFYGDGDRFMEIFNANRAVITSPDRLPDGAELLIPGIDSRGRMLADSASR